MRVNQRDLREAVIERAKALALSVRPLHLLHILSTHRTTHGHQYSAVHCPVCDVCINRSITHLHIAKVLLSQTRLFIDFDVI
jgi:hypothetical protein